MLLSTVGRRVGTTSLINRRILNNFSGNRHKQYSSSRKNHSNKKKDDIPPPLPSPSKAKQEYLKSRKELLEDPQKKIAQLTQELETVRNDAAAKLDAELNKSVWRKLTDPLRRHKHSVINMGAMCLAYLLAYNLFLKSKAEKEARQKLIDAEQKTQELQTVLQSLLETKTLQEIAKACTDGLALEEDEQQFTQKSSFLFGSRGSSRRNARSGMIEEQNREEVLDKLQEVLEKQLAQRIGETAMTEEQKQRKSIQEIWEESESKVKALNENPELMLLEALMEEEKSAQPDKQTKQRRVFSM